MKTLIKAAAMAAALTCLATPAAFAQTAERVYDTGPVWQISFVETKPGMFDDYLAYLSNNWRTIQEAWKKKGDVLDYQVLATDSPRDNEADVILIVKYKNMAVFDRSLAEQEAVSAGVFGSVVKSNQAAVSRESLRTLRGGFTARELRFIK